MLGLRLKGENHEGRYVIADVRMRHDYPTRRRALFEPACNPGGTVLIHRQPDDIWRIDYQVPADADLDHELAEATVRAKVGAVLEEIGHAAPWELEWWSAYTANTLCLDDYRSGRVYFAGDSAHIVPIFGVRGLNNGLADAQNVAWKLAYVLDGRAGAELLDSYTAERRAATLDVFRNATKSARFMTPPSEGWRLAREAALSLSVSHDFARRLADPRQMRPFAYGDAGCVFTPKTRAGGPEIGAVAPDARLFDGGFLRDGFGPGLTAVLFGDGDGAALAAALQKIDPTAVVLVTADPVATERYAAAAGGVALIRPDDYVAGWLAAADVAGVEAAARRALGLSS